MLHQTSAGGGRVILNQEQWHGLISTGISECMDPNMKNQEEKRSKWRKVANEAGLEVKQAIAAWKKLRHLGRQAAIACHIEKNKRRRSGSGNDIHEEDEEALFLENFKCPANVSVISKQLYYQYTTTQDTFHLVGEKKKKKKVHSAAEQRQQLLDIMSKKMDMDSSSNSFMERTQIGKLLLTSKSLYDQGVITEVQYMAQVVNLQSKFLNTD